MNFSDKNIVIVGGMGPQASIELHRQVIARAAKLGAHGGADFPAITHLSLPIEDFISDPTKTTPALGALTSALERVYLWRRDPNSYCV